MRRAMQPTCQAVLPSKTPCGSSGKKHIRHTDSSNKTHAQFTNLVAEPGVETGDEDTL